ncbi:MAG TPA: hypothetical protein VK457_04830 [Chloroflexota bacterium]|jgi:hypothetical protein|nr:hypothetical protein [Chloroflexota bacterium]
MAVHSTSFRQRALHIPSQAIVVVLMAGMFAAAVFGLVRGESHLSQSKLTQVQSVQGNFQPAGDSQSAYSRTSEPIQPVGVRAAVNPR